MPSRMLRSLIIACMMPTALTAAVGAGLTVANVSNAFQSTGGIMLRAAECSFCETDLNVSTLGSATVWRDDLPLALWVPPGAKPRDSVGTIFALEGPGAAVAACAYVVDANSNVRNSPSSNGSGILVNDHCGKTTGGVENLTNVTRISGPCRSEDAQDFAAEFFLKPSIGIFSDMGIPAFWDLESGQCSFSSLVHMLDAQRLLLRLALNVSHKPGAMTHADWLGNVTKIGYGITAFNEVAVAPPTQVAGLFWAHDGPFRAPNALDRGACSIAKLLRNESSSASALPIFELAGVNLERPFKGCFGADPHTALPGCLSRGLAEWDANLTTTKGGRDPATVFRQLAPSVFEHLSRLLCAI